MDAEVFEAEMTALGQLEALDEADLEEEAVAGEVGSSFEPCEAFLEEECLAFGVPCPCNGNCSSAHCLLDV